MNCNIKLSLKPRVFEDMELRTRNLLSSTHERMGLIPNIYADMSNFPALLDTYLHGYSLFRAESDLTPIEQEVVFLTISQDNHSAYCVAAHRTLADTISGVSPEITNAIRDRQPIPEQQLAALSDFTRVMIASRGCPSEHELHRFLVAGYTERHILDITLAIGIKILSNYTSRLFHTPIDEVFAAGA